MKRITKTLAILAAIILPGGIVFMGLAFIHALREVRKEREQLRPRNKRVPFAVPLATSRLTDADDTMRIVYTSNAELIAQDPEGIFKNRYTA